jgi:hypothetical protein
VSVLEPNLNRSAIRHHQATAVRNGDFASFQLFEVELDRDVLWQAKMDGASVNKTVDVNGLKVGPNRIGKPKAAADDAHRVVS